MGARHEIDGSGEPVLLRPDRSTLVTFEAGGHTPCNEEPEELLRALGDRLRNRT